MDEDSYISKIQAFKDAADPEVDVVVYELIEEALAHFPDSAALWDIKGDMIQLGPEECPYELEDALASYLRAIEVDPMYAPAHTSLGYYYDIHQADQAKALQPFMRAIELDDQDPWAYVGLARALTELGRANEALDLLGKCPLPDDDHIVEIRNEINEGMWDPA